MTTTRTARAPAAPAARIRPEAALPPGRRSGEQEVAQRPQTDAAHRERLAVERAQVGPVRGGPVVAELLPHALPDLVGRGLPRPPEIAVDLEPDERLVHVDVLGHEAEGVLAGPAAGAVRLGL